MLDTATMVDPAYDFEPLVDGWETVAEMEPGLGMPDGALAATMATTTSTPRRATTPRSTRPPNGSCRWTRGRGARTTSRRAGFYAGFRCGGLRVAVDGQVLRADGTAVPGAYAAGAVQPTSPSTAAGTRGAPSSARRRTSAAAPDGTPPR